MAILVDEAIWPWRDRLWCHLISDTSLDELHDFAGAMGISERAFQGDHYDIPEEARSFAIDEGAIPVDSRRIVLALHGAGLRRRPTILGGHHQP